MKKRSLILSILCVVLAISMTSCAKDDDDSSSQGFHGVDVADENGEYADSVYDTEIEKPPADTNSASTTLSPRDTQAGEVVTDHSDDTQVDNQGTVDSSVDSSTDSSAATPDKDNPYYQPSDDEVDEDRGYVFKEEDFEPVEEVRPECNKDIYDEDFDSFLRDRTGADRNYWIDKLVNNGFTRAEAEKEYDYWVALKQALESESEQN